MVKFIDQSIICWPKTSTITSYITSYSPVATLLILHKLATTDNDENYTIFITQRNLYYLGLSSCTDVLTAGLVYLQDQGSCGREIKKREEVA